jgi:hypothetical protein
MANIAFILLCHKDPDAIIRQALSLTAVGDLISIRNSQAPPRGLSVGFGVSLICHLTHEVFDLV